MEKPITLQIEDLKNKIITVINEFNLPMDIIGSLLKDLYNDVHLECMNQLIKDMQVYEEALKKESDNIKSMEG